MPMQQHRHGRRPAHTHGDLGAERDQQQVACRVGGADHPRREPADAVERRWADEEHPQQHAGGHGDDQPVDQRADVRPAAAERRSIDAPTAIATYPRRRTRRRCSGTPSLCDDVLEHQPRRRHRRGSRPAADDQEPGRPRAVRPAQTRRRRRRGRIGRCRRPSRCPRPACLRRSGSTARAASSRRRRAASPVIGVDARRRPVHGGRASAPLDPRLRIAWSPTRRGGERPVSASGVGERDDARSGRIAPCIDHTTRSTPGLEERRRLVGERRGSTRSRGTRGAPSA